MGIQSIKAPKLILQAQSAARSGDVSRAEELYRQVLARFPGNRRAREGLARLVQNDPRVDDLLELWSSGQADAALKCSFDLSVDHPTVRDIRAAALRKLGRPLEAIELYETALQADKRNDMILFNLGAAWMEAYQHSKAADCLEAACQIKSSPMCRIALVQCRLDQGYHRLAAELCEALLQDTSVSGPDRARVNDMYGTALLQLGQTEQAIAAHNTAKSFAPKDPRVRHNLGIAANALGKRDEAMAHFRAALSSDPTRATIHRSLARLTAYREDHPHLSQMLSLLETGLPAAEEAELRFALFKAFDDIQDHDTAMMHLQRGNDLRRAQFGYDPAKDTALFHRIAELNPPVLTACSGPRCIYIVGLPRSGTTLTEQILSGAPGTVALGELPVVGHAATQVLRKHNTGAISRQTLEEFASTCQAGRAAYAQDGDVLLDKMPLNFRWADLILAAQPDARILWLDRSAPANAWSMYHHFFAGAGNRFAYGLRDIAKMIHHERAMRDHITSKWPNRVKVVSLEEMTNAPELTIREVIGFCQLPWSDACLAPNQRDRTVLTASAQQVRDPIKPHMSGVDHLPDTYVAPVRHALNTQTALA